MSFEGDGADQAGVIGLIRQGFVTVGLEADQPDRDRVSSDQVISRSGCDRSDQGHVRSHEPSICQAHCLVQRPLRFFPVPPNPTCARFPIWGFPNMTATWGSARSTLSKFMAFEEIILLNLLRGVRLGARVLKLDIQSGYMYTYG